MIGAVGGADRRYRGVSLPADSCCLRRHSLLMPSDWFGLGWEKVVKTKVQTFCQLGHDSDEPVRPSLSLPNGLA